MVIRRDSVKLYQVDADGLRTTFPPLRRDVDPSERMAYARIRGWEAVWGRSPGVGHQPDI